MQKIILFKSIVYYQMHLYCVAWGKGLASWLLFVMFIMILLLSHLVSWYRLYRLTIAVVLAQSNLLEELALLVVLLSLCLVLFVILSSSFKVCSIVLDCIYS